MAPVPDQNLDDLYKSSLVDRALFPLYHVFKRALPADPAKYDPGHGVRAADTFNNKGFFALFAILGAAMVVISIWFFFWAKNGGFHWRKDDWSDYKSTVLRRKDANGKTLTNATPQTNLGEKSIAGTWDIEKDDRDNMSEAQDFTQARGGNNGKRARPNQQRREPSDDDLKAYRRERSAKVGGINRQEDGSQFASSNASRSDIGSDLSSKPLRPSPLKQEQSAPKKGFLEKKREKAAEKKAEKAQKKENAKQKKEEAKKPTAQSGRPRHVFAADEASNADMSQNRYNDDPDAYMASYRPPAPPHAASRRHEQRQSARQYAQPPQRQSPSHSRQPSPTKPSTAQHHQRHPGSFDAYSDAGTSDTGTKVYSHHIPELSRGSRDTGFRRGMGGGRRDSLSDSDEDDLAAFRRR